MPRKKSKKKELSAPEERQLEIENEDWDFEAAECMSCGQVGWTKGKVDDHGNITKCDKCPITKVHH